MYENSAAYLNKFFFISPQTWDYIINLNFDFGSKLIETKENNTIRCLYLKNGIMIRFFFRCIAVY